MPRRLAAAGAALAVLAAACGAGAHRAGPGPAGTAAASTAAASTSAAASGAGQPSSGAPRLAWRPCQGGFDCARLVVPLSYAHPGAGRVSLALIRARATDPARRIGDLLINPGGPGVSTVSEFAGLVGLLSPGLRARFDVVGFDPRGVGASDPVECLDGPGLDRFFALDVSPETPAQRAALQAGTRAFVAACQRRSGALLAHVGTVDVARDVDRIRRALGDATISYLGFSYGTFLGAEYAHLFPTHLRAAVLDGALDPTLPPIQSTDDQSVGFEHDLDAFIAQCAADPSCVWRPAGSRLGDVESLLSRLGRAPLPTGTGRSLTESEAFYGLGAALYSTDTWPLLAEALAAADGGDGAPLLALSDSYTGRRPDGSYPNELTAQIAVSCRDYPWPSSPAAYFAAAAAAARQAPVFGPPNLLTSLACAYWPVRAAHDVAAPVVRGGPAILVVATTGDPATPYAEGVRLARELGTARLLTRVGEGHTGYPASACVRGWADAYLEHLALPPVGARCPS